MLKKLDIRNFTLIDHLEMALYPGFSVITGETGAGKSIVIGAIGLLLGNRADAKQVKRGCDKCIIEATFDLSIYHSDVLKDFFEDNDLDYEPEECLLREVKEETGYTLTSWKYRGIITFIYGEDTVEYMSLYTADGFTGEPVECNEGDLIWVDKEKVLQLNIWEGDRIFLRLLNEKSDFFSLKLVYNKEGALIQPVLDGKALD